MAHTIEIFKKHTDTTTCTANFGIGSADRDLKKKLAVLCHWQCYSK